MDMGLNVEWGRDAEGGHRLVLLVSKLEGTL